MKLSVVIPTYNEEGNILNLLKLLKIELENSDYFEIIVVDGGSTDNTVKIIREFEVELLQVEKGRGNQLHAGAQKAVGKLLYFLHADSIPPPKFHFIIQNEIALGFEVGCFQLKFTPTNFVLRFYEYFVKFPFLVCRGGDQSLFITKELYMRIGGFKTNFKLMEDIDFIKRVSKESKFKILNEKVQTSSRKFEDNGVVKLQILFAIMHLLFWLGLNNKSIYKFYNKTVK